MPAAAPYIKAAFVWLASEQIAAVIVRTILINVALGALEFEDGDSTWVAVE